MKRSVSRRVCMHNPEAILVLLLTKLFTTKLLLAGILWCNLILKELSCMDSKPIGCILAKAHAVHKGESIRTVYKSNEQCTYQTGRKCVEINLVTGLNQSCNEH